MIYCTTKPLKDYDTTLLGRRIGLYSTYKERPAMLQMVMQITTAPYLWEAQGVPDEAKPAAIAYEHEAVFSDTLYARLSKQSPMIIGMLATMTPLEFYQYLKFTTAAAIATLPICRHFTVEQVITTAGGRAAAWLYGTESSGLYASVDPTELREIVNMNNTLKEWTLRYAGI